MRQLIYFIAYHAYRQIQMILGPDEFFSKLTNVLIKDVFPIDQHIEDVFPIDQHFDDFIPIQKTQAPV